MAQIVKNGQNRKVLTDYGITGVQVRFSMAQLIAMQHMQVNVETLNKLLVDNKAPAEIVFNEAMLLVIRLEPMLRSIIGDIPMPFADNLWEFNPKDSED